MSNTNDTTNQLSRRTKDQLIVDLVEVRAELDMLRRVSDDLRQSAARYHELFEQSPIGIWEEDFSGARVKIEDWRRDGVRDFRMFFSDHSEKPTLAVPTRPALSMEPAFAPGGGKVSPIDLYASPPNENNVLSRQVPTSQQS